MGCDDWGSDDELCELVFLPHPVCGSSSVFRDGKIYGDIWNGFVAMQSIYVRLGIGLLWPCLEVYTESGKNLTWRVRRSPAAPFSNPCWDMLRTRTIQVHITYTASKPSDIPGDRPWNSRVGM